MFHDKTLERDVRKEATDIIKKYYGTENCTLVSSGTAAIEVALKALELPKGSKVIIPDVSFIATATAVANVGLIPVYGDCALSVWGISVNEVERLHKQYPDVKGCIVVHFSGIVNRDIKKIADYCSKENLYLIEDCAQVFGASYDGVKCGMFGDIGTFSFQTSKVITCGEGGMVISKEQEIANKVQAISDWGLDLHSERNLSLPSSNLRINPFAAEYLKNQLDNCHEILKNRVDLYNEFCKMAIEMGFQVQFRAVQEQYSDMPFFLLLKVKNKQTCVLHPIDEYPMHVSKLVRSILRVQYPEHLEEYDKIISEQNYSESMTMVKETNFLPMYGVTVKNMKNKLAELLENS